MSRQSLTSNWISDFCAPVVTVIATSEVENLSIQNGLLFHDLLRAFSHIDINTSVRSCTQVITSGEAVIRFERSTEAMVKSSGTIEELLRYHFQEYDLAKLPASINELKGSVPPTAWNTILEHIVTRSLSFSEYEMLSHPTVLLYAVSTSDYDVVECMQEIVSKHHMPTCCTTGQYDISDVSRVYLLVHDPHLSPTVDPVALLRKLQGKFAPSQTKMITINSIPPDTPNLQHPDLWSRFTTPMYFPQLAPEVPITRNSSDGSRVFGSRLSMEDFVTLRGFCVGMYQQDITFCLERRISNLFRIVTDARKGVKNVFKSFWKKPKEDTPVFLPGTLRYRYDRIESQILLLADTLFMIKDYETALSWYKMVREDFKSDKSMSHLAHTCIMSTLCYILTDSSRKELGLQLESLSQVLSTIDEPLHGHALYALLASDMYMNHSPIRAPLDAANILLSAAAAVSKLDLLSGLLIEKAATMYLYANQTRKFLFHEVLSGLKIRNCGPKPALHGLVCASCALLLQDESKYSELLAKIALLIAGDMKLTIQDNIPTYILLMLKSAMAALNDQSYVTGEMTSIDTIAQTVLLNFTDPQYHIYAVMEGWDKATTFDILQNPYYVYKKDQDTVESTMIQKSTTSSSLLDIVGLSVPEIIMDKINIMIPLNGTLSMTSSNHLSTNYFLVEKLKKLAIWEKEWSHKFEYYCSQQLIHPSWSSTTLSTNYPLGSTPVPGSNNSSVISSPIRHSTKSIETMIHEFWSKYIEIEYQDELLYRSDAGTPVNQGILTSSIRNLEYDIYPMKVPLGEKFNIQIQLKNPFATPLMLTSLCLIMNDNSAFDITLHSVELSPRQEMTVNLQATSLQLGSYSVIGIRWDLLDYGISIKQPVQKSGKYLQKTLKQRAMKQRREDNTLQITVIPSYPLLNISMIGLPDTVLHGQLIKTVLTIHNEGLSPAHQIYIKTNCQDILMCLECDIDDHIESCVSDISTNVNFITSTMTAVSGNNKNKNKNKNKKKRVFLSMIGQSGTLFKLPDDVSIAPSDKYHIHAWIRPKHLGIQKTSILISYVTKDQASDTIRYWNGIMSSSSPSDSRTSCYIVELNVQPSVQLRSSIITRPTSVSNQTLFMNIFNRLVPSSNTSTSLTTSSMLTSTYINTTTDGLLIDLLTPADTLQTKKIFLDMDLSIFPSYQNSSFSMDQNLENGQICLDGSFILGSSTPYRNTELLTKYRNLKANYSEIMSLTCPLHTQYNTVTHRNYEDMSNMQDYLKSLSNSWFLSLSKISDSIDTYTDINDIGTTQNTPVIDNKRNNNNDDDYSHFIQIIEQFICYDFIYDMNQYHRQQVYTQLMIGDDDQKGPKSISQVRKENEKKLQQSTSQPVKVSSTDLLSNDMSDVFNLIDIPLHDESIINTSNDLLIPSSTSNTNLANLISTQQNKETIGQNQLLHYYKQLGISCSVYGLPIHLKDIIYLVNTKHELINIVIWSCKWNNEVLSGFHYNSNISLLHSSSLSKPLSADISKIASSDSCANTMTINHVKEITPSVLDKLLIQFSHPLKVSLTNYQTSMSKSHSIKPVIVKIEMIIKNINSFPLYITVQPILHSGSLFHPNSYLPSPAGTPRDPSEVNAYNTSFLNGPPTGKINEATPTINTNTQCKHIQWVGKLRYVAQEITSNGTIKLTFNASFHKPGVYNIVRFRVQVGSTSSSQEAELLMKPFTYESYIDVTST